MNFSHGSLDFHLATIEAVRRVTGQESAANRLVALMLDTKGPEIRTTKVKCVDGSSGSGEGIELIAGSRVRIQCWPHDMSQTPSPEMTSTSECIGVLWEGMARAVNVGSAVMLDDGLIGLRVLSTNPDSSPPEIECVIENSGTSLIFTFNRSIGR